jgi:acyl-CoA dehydrogenase
VLVQTRATLASAPLNGRAAWDNDAIRERFARCLVRLRGLDAACDSYAASFDGPGGMLAGMLFKVAAADCLQYVVGECVQLRGSASFADQGLAQLHAAVAAWSLAGGATGAMLAGIADHADELLAAT